MRKTLALGILALALLAAPALAEDIIYFTNGSAMPIKSFKIEKGMVHVDLGGNGMMAFPESLVDRIEKAGDNVMLDHSYHINKIPSPEGSYPARGQERSRKAIPVPQPHRTDVGIDPKTGLATYKPMGNSKAKNRRKLGVVGNTTAYQNGLLPRGGNNGGGQGRESGYLGATPMGGRHVIGGATDPRGNVSRKPAIVTIEPVNRTSPTMERRGESKPQPKQQQDSGDSDGSGDN